MSAIKIFILYRMLQTFGLDHMGAYPFVRAAIIGHANKESPTNCRQVNNFVPPGKQLGVAR